MTSLVILREKYLVQISAKWNNNLENFTMNFLYSQFFTISWSYEVTTLHTI